MLGCPADQQYDAGLCYPFCPENYSNAGPVCWQNCQNGNSDCGALCTETVAVCTATVKSIVGNVFALASVIAKGVVSEGEDLDIPEILKDAGVIATDLTYGICEHKQKSFFSFLE